MYPSYLELYKRGELRKRIKQAYSLLESCSLCPRKCGVNRAKDKKGFCKTGYLARIYSYMPHFGEEPSISGNRGSGTIFFSGCNMACVYCQNYKFSQLNGGREVESEELALIMLELQESNCHNINLVTPTHVMPQVLQALSLAIPKGLNLPLIYNTSGYELPEVIKLLNGIVDIFLPDMRYAEDEISIKYSSAPDYPKYNRAAVKEMHQQVGIAQIDKSRTFPNGDALREDRKVGDKQGLINRGLIIRHLVLPDNISGTARTMDFIAKKISSQTYISLMRQYFPCYKADKFPEIFRRVSRQEYTQAKQILLKFGLYNGWFQESEDSARFAGTKIERR